MNIRRLAVVGLASLALVGCSTVTGGDNASNSASNGDSSGVNPKDVLIIAQNSDVKTLDPHNASERPAERVNRNVYSRLFDRTPDNEIVPEIVTDYEQVNETTWRFKLRDDVKFSNGDPLTAKDVEYSLTRVSTDESLLEQSRWAQISEVTALDDYEVEIVTDGPMPTLLNLLSKSGGDILPSRYIEENGLEAFIQSPIGSGPYQIVSWERDSRVVLEPNPEYYGEPASWRQVIVRAIPESSTRTSELTTGGVDIITDVPPIEWDRVEGSGEARLIHGESSRTMLMIVRMTEGTVTADPKVREAIDLAVDEQEIIDALLPGGVAVPTRTRAPQGVFGGHPDLYGSYLADMDGAKALVQEVGGGDPIPLKLTAPRGRYPMDAEVAELVTAMLSEAGFEVELEILEGGAFSDVYGNKTNEELLLIALADAMLDASYSLNHYQKDRAEGQTDYFNPEVEDLMHQGNRTFDEAERERIYHRVQEIVAEERPHIPMFQLNATYGVAADIEWTPTFDEAMVFDDVKVVE